MSTANTRSQDKQLSPFPGMYEQASAGVTVQSNRHVCGDVADQGTKNAGIKMVKYNCISIL